MKREGKEDNYLIKYSAFLIRIKIYRKTLSLRIISMRALFLELFDIIILIYVIKLSKNIHGYSLPPSNRLLPSKWNHQRSIFFHSRHPSNHSSLLVPSYQLQVSISKSNSKMSRLPRDRNSCSLFISRDQHYLNNSIQSRFCRGN